MDATSAKRPNPRLAIVALGHLSGEQVTLALRRRRGVARTKGHRSILQQSQAGLQTLHECDRSFEDWCPVTELTQLGSELQVTQRSQGRSLGSNDPVIRRAFFQVLRHQRLAGTRSVRLQAGHRGPTRVRSDRTRHRTGRPWPY